MINRLFLYLLISLSVFEASAKMQVAKIFGNKMVLQQEELVSIWGRDTTNQAISITASWGQSAKTTCDKNGYWKVLIQTPSAGGPYTMNIKGSKKIVFNDIMIGEVWLASGQSNMVMKTKGYNKIPVEDINRIISEARNNQIRMFTVTTKLNPREQEDIYGRWLSCDTTNIQQYSMVAYFFAKRLQEQLNIPIGIINASVGGSDILAWMDSSTYKHLDFSATINKQHPKDFTKYPTQLFNGMIHPLLNYRIKGIIWYQGESNVAHADEYERLLKSLIQSWRVLLKQENLAFYYVQIAPYSYPNINAAYLREAQWNVYKTVKNTGIVSTSDIGDFSNIHPTNKETVGNRLANWALAKDYHQESQVYLGPEYKEKNLRANHQIELLFDTNGGKLLCKGNDIVGFEVAGADKQFYPAKAIIASDNSILISSDKVSAPIEVRYCFQNCIQGNLYNSAHLPAFPFRTDSF